jgi:hypothetical protein
VFYSSLVICSNLVIYSSLVFYSSLSIFFCNFFFLVIKYKMSLIQSAITASAEVIDFSNNLALNLFTRETDRAGTALLAHKTNNYLNFVVDVDTFTAKINLSGDGPGNDSAVFSFSDASNAVAAACTFYDVRFTSGSNSHGTINISDFVTLDKTGVEETLISFSGTGVTPGSSDGALDASAGSVALTVSFSTDSSNSAVSTNISYAVADTVSIVATKEDNVLAADSIAWDAAPTPDQAAADVLSTAGKGFGALSGDRTVTGSVSAITITDSDLTAAIQNLLDISGADYADPAEIASVRTALNALATDSSGATFKGLLGVTDAVTLAVGSELAGDSQSTNISLTPQIFFQQYVTNGSTLEASTFAG